MENSCLLPSGRDCIEEMPNWKSFIEKLRLQWVSLWRERIDDKVRAEGIASEDFSLLFIDRGTVIVATRQYKHLEFKEILDEYDAPYAVKAKSERPLPSVGGWRKFGRQIATSCRSRKRQWLEENKLKKGRRKGLQLKKGGRGWLHISK